MSKKTKRPKRRTNLPASNYINQLHIEQLKGQARHQLLQGDFAGVVDTCQYLLKRYLQQRTPLRAEVLAYMGLAYSMMQQYDEDYDAFTEAVSIDPTNAELWYNRGLASYFTTRIGQAVRDHERAFELLNTSSNLARHRDELRPKFLKELESSRKLAEHAMKLRGPDFTLDQLIEQDEWFHHGLKMAKVKKWKEAEQAFRRVIEMGECQPQHSGNLGVALLMQQRYDEAEAALNRALEFDPEYKLARDNLAALPAIRLGKRPVEVTINNEPDSDVEPSINLFQHGNGTQPDVTHVIEKDRTKAYLGKQPPRYRLFLNPYDDVRFTRCPQCGKLSRQRKLPLVIHVEPTHTLVLNKTCRYCPDCDLLIVHQDLLEGLLVAVFEEANPEMIGNDYLVIGTVDRADWKEGMQNTISIQKLFDTMHDFKEAVTFKLAGA